MLLLGYKIDLFDDNNIFEWKISIPGPKDSVYSDRLFYLKIIFPDDYPLKPPEIAFLTPIYHVNVNLRKPKRNEIGIESLGHISFSVTMWWKEDTTILELFLKLYSIFYFANNDDPYGIERCDEFRYNRAFYDKKAQYFTYKYANLMKEKEDYSEKDWDFSMSYEEIKCLENENKNKSIDLLFNINSKEKKMNCRQDELTKDAIAKLNIDIKREDLLVIYKNTKIKSIIFKENKIIIK